ncbi:MAG TPA: glycosyltransferase [Vicinamibacterales bacterium]|nr:glycosyltransferase [Vicinamibacterales bacterium]
MIRVCHVMTADLWAGAEVQLATALSYLAARPDVAVNAVLFNDGRLANELRRLGIDVTVIDERRHNAIQIVRLLTRVITDHRVDFVHTHRYKDTILGIIAARLAGVPHVVRTMHGLPEPMSGWSRLKYGMYETLDRAMLRCFADRVIAVSHRVAATLIAAAFRPSLVTTVHNGIDVQTVHATRSRDEMRRELGLTASTVVFGTAGRLTAVKGHDTFLHAARLILDREPGATFIIAGGGPLEDELMALASALGIAPACRFLGARHDIHDVMAAMDVFVLPSLNEGLPMAILEAMAMSRPVVASDVGGLREVIRHGHTGLLVPPANAPALAAAALELARDGELAGRMAAQAKRVVEERFNRERNGAAVVDLYHAVGRQQRRRIGGVALAVGFASALFEYGVRKVSHAFERLQVNRLRRSPSALVDALRAGKNILVVCHGNIIRSPFAASLLAQSLGTGSLVSIASAGLEAMPGRPPHPTALRQAAERRIDLSSHASSRVEGDVVKRSDVIFVMDIPQLLALRRRFPEARGRTFLLTSLAPETPLEIRDPVDGDESVFQACFDHITRAIRPLATVLTQSPQRT